MTEIEKLQQELFQIIEYIERNAAKINQNTWKVYVEQIFGHLGDARIVIDELKASSSNIVAPVDNIQSEEKDLIDFRELVLSEYRKGNITVLSHEGVMSMPLKEFVKQPAEGILYDLNRNESVVLTFIKDPKWVNDYAVAKVIQELKRQIEEQTIPVDNIESRETLLEKFMMFAKSVEEKAKELHNDPLYMVSVAIQEWLKEQTNPVDNIVESEKKIEAFEGLMMDYASECWKAAANAHRMYPDNKHTFSQAKEYLLEYGRKLFQTKEVSTDFIKFGMFLTGHGEKDINQMYNDWKNSQQ